MRCATRRTGGVLVAARRAGRPASPSRSPTPASASPRADQARIFDEFVQIGNPERDRGKGLGLGLAIAQRLAAILGSRIEIASVEGRGSRFSFALPGAEPAEPAKAVAAPDLMRGLRVLLVDDDAMVREGAGLLLRPMGRRGRAGGGPGGGRGAWSREPRGSTSAWPTTACRATVNGLGVIARPGRPADAPRAFCLVTGDMGAEVLAAADAAGVPIIHKPLHPARLRALLNHLAAGGVERRGGGPRPPLGPCRSVALI